jgi:hypothetical protein
VAAYKFIATVRKFVAADVERGAEMFKTLAAA